MEGLSVSLQLSRSGFRLDAAFDLQPGRITGLSGPSAAGKTTLLRCMAGLQRPDAGHLALNGTAWFCQQEKTWVPAEHRHIGYVAQKNDLFPHLNVRSNLALASARPQADAGKLLATLGVQELLDRPIAGLSGGQTQRVRVARALLRDAPLLLLDEPFNMLDIAARNRLLTALAEHVRGSRKVALLTSHTPEDLAQVATETILLHDGKLQAHGPTASVLNDPERAFAQGARAGALLECKYAAQAPEHGLQALQIDGATDCGTMWIAAPSREPGYATRIYVHARDVSLTRSAASDSSIQNILPARVQCVRVRPDALVMVALQIGEQQVHACITRRAQEHLHLQSGEPVYAQIKSVSLLG